MASPGSGDNVLEKLQKELKEETFSRQLQEELNSKLQDEYDVLLKRLAEAELHIDRMRFCPGVELNKYFLIRHHTEQHSTLRQRLAANFDPTRLATPGTGDDPATTDSISNHALKSTGVGTDATPLSCEDTSNNSFNSADHIKADGNQTTLSSDESDTFRSGSPSGNSTSNVDNSSHEKSAEEHSIIEGAGQYVPLSPHIVNSSRNGVRSQRREGEGELMNSVDRWKSSFHLSRDSQSDSSVSSLDSSNSVLLLGQHHRGRSGFKGHPDAPSESQELLLNSSSSQSPSPTHPQTAISTLCPIPHSFADTDDTSLSEMSTSAEENRGSAESMQLAHLFKVHSLQEELARLKTKLDDRGIPLDEIIEDLGQIHGEHQQLARDVEASSAHLEALRQKYNGKVSDRLAKSKRAVGNELANLVGQLQELYELVNAKARTEREGEEGEREVNLLPLLPSSEGLVENKDSDSRLSNTFYDSLNSPHLPAKYLNHDTSTDNQHQSSEGPPLRSTGMTSLTHSVTPPSNSTHLESNINSGSTHHMTRMKSPASTKTPPSHSTPRGSNSGTTLSNGTGLVHSSEQKSRGELPPRNRPCSHGFENIKSATSRNGRGAKVEGSAHRGPNSGYHVEQLIELDDTDEDKQSQSDIPSDVSDLILSDEDLHIQNEATLSSDDSSDHSGSRDVNLMRSPDSYYLQQAKENLKRAEKLGYRGRSSGDNYNSQRTSGDEKRNGQSLKHSNTVSSRIPRLTPSRYSPHLQSPHARSSHRWQNSNGCATNKDQSHMTFPGEADSGFAGSEFPSRTATRMDASVSSPTERGRYENTLTSSVLQSTGSEEEVNRQRFEEATAAIEALRKELADIKEQMMRNVQRQNEETNKCQDSIPNTPLSHSHSTTQPLSRTHSTIPQSSSAISGKRNSNRDHPFTLSRANGRYSDNLSAPPSLVLHPIPSRTTPSDGLSSTSTLPITSLCSLPSSSHHSLAGRQMTTNTLTTEPMAPSRIVDLDGGQSLQLTTITPVATPSHHLLASRHRRSLVSGQLSQPPTNAATVNQIISTPSRSLVPPPRDHTMSGRQSTQPITATQLIATPSHSISTSQHSLVGGQFTHPTTATTQLIGTPSRSLASPLHSFAGEHLKRPPTIAQLISTPSHSYMSPLHTVVGGESRIPTTTPSHSLKSTSPAHSYLTEKSTNTIATVMAKKANFISPHNTPNRNPSYLQISTPSLSAICSVNSTPIPTSQHSSSTTARAKSTAHLSSSVRGSHFSSNPSSDLMYVSGFPSDDQFHSERREKQNPEHYVYGEEGGRDSTRYRYNNPAQSNSSVPSQPPSRISCLDNRGSLNQYQVPSCHSEQLRPNMHVYSVHSDRLPSQHSEDKPDLREVRRTSSDAINSDSAPASTVSIEQSATYGSLDVEVDTSSTDRFCPNCGERGNKKKVSQNESERRFSDSFVPHRPRSCSGSYCGERKGDHVQVNDVNRMISCHGEVSEKPVMEEGSVPGQLVQSDCGGVGRQRKLEGEDFSQSMSFNRAQRPVATSTPSRKSAVFNPRRHRQTQAPSHEEDRAKKVEGTFVKLSRNVSKRESSTAAPPLLSTNDNEIQPSEVGGVTSNEIGSQLYLSSVATHSPKRKKSADMYAARASTQSSPTHSQVHGFGSDTFSSAHSLPALRHSNVRRASSPGLTASGHKTNQRVYRQMSLDDRESKSNRLAYRVRHSTDSSSDSSEESYHDDIHVGTRWTPPGTTVTMNDDVVCVTPRAHIPTSAKRASNRGYQPPREQHIHVRNGHYSEPDNIPEHLHVYVHGGRRVKTPVVKVIETPKVKKKKKRVVYLASSPTPSPNEVYYARGSARYTPKSTSKRRRVVGIAEGISRTSPSRRSTSRGDGLDVRGKRQKKKKVYMEPAKSGKRVYVVEQSSDGSSSSTEQFDTLETCDLDLEDTLRLANELKKRTRRLKGTLQAELDRQRFY